MRSRVFHWKIEGRVRLHETHPHRKWPRGILFQIPHRARRDVRAQHLRLDPGIGQFVGIEPDSRRILKRLPRRLGTRLRRNRLRLHVPHPRCADFVFGHHEVETEQSRSCRPIEMHLTEDRGGVARGLELSRERRFVRSERSRQASDARHVRQLPGEEALPRGRAHRRVAVVPGEASPFRGQGVQIRRCRQPVTVAAHRVSRVVVGQQEYEIRPARGSHPCAPPQPSCCPETFAGRA